MRKSQSSLTASGIAIIRALESLKPEGERICYDPFARQFANPWLYYFAKFFVDIGYAPKRGPGVMEFIVSRARYMDDFLQIYIDDGLEQLVILGAGFDSRAYRFEKLKGRVKVFEVDHPATQQAKLEKLKKIFGQLPNHVIYVPVDFNQEALKKRVYESGFDKGLKTLFIWEGVTPYLTPEAIDDTLAFIVNNSGKDSAVIFDYVYTRLLQEASKRGEIKRMQRYRGFTGEGLTFGIEEGTIEAFLQLRGFYQVKNMDSQDLKELYLTGVNQKRMMATGYAVVSAVVHPKGNN